MIRNLTLVLGIFSILAACAFAGPLNEEMMMRLIQSSNDAVVARSDNLAPRSAPFAERFKRNAPITKAPKKSKGRMLVDVQPGMPMYTTTTIIEVSPGAPMPYGSPYGNPYPGPSRYGGYPPPPYGGGFGRPPPMMYGK